MHKYWVLGWVAGYPSNFKLMSVLVSHVHGTLIERSWWIKLNLMWTAWFLQILCFTKYWFWSLFCKSPNSFSFSLCFNLFNGRYYSKSVQIWLWWSFKPVFPGADVGSGEVQSTDQETDRSSSPKRLNPRWQILKMKANQSANVALTYKWTEKVYIYYYV